MVCYLFLALLLPHVIAYNVDVKSPYVIKVSEEGSNSLFGFSTALHEWNDKGTVRRYILVGAPRANWTGDMTYTQPGAIYKCPIDSSITNPTSEASCSEQVDYISSVNEDKEDKSNQWLGVNVESSNDHVTACAHRYMYTGQNNDKRVPVGQCIVVGPSLSDDIDDVVQRKVLYPCRIKTVDIITRSCQVGASLVQYTKKASSFMFYGGPGVDTWEGGAYLNQELNKVSTPKETEQIRPGVRDFNQYSGYSVAMCNMRNSTEPDLITAAPRANNYLGMVYFFYSTDNTNDMTLLRNSNQTDELTGDQMGAYYGYSMACGDLDGDGLDDLLVSAPWYSLSTSTKSAITSVGRVYVYYADREKLKLINNANKPTILEAPSVATSAFGLALAHIGDINKDGHQDFAVGAPYEDDYTGAIYIYHGYPSGIRKTPVQTIRPRDLGALGVNLKTFGWSISANKDMDDNSYTDMAVGAYKSDRVVYLRSLPIIDLDIEIDIPDDPVDLSEDNMELPDSRTNAKYPGTTLRICFTPTKISTGAYTVEYKIDLDFKQSFAPRAFFQQNTNTNREFSKEGFKEIDVTGRIRQCTTKWPVYLKKEMFDDKSYIEVSITANVQETDDIDKRAVLNQGSVSKAKGRIVIKSICAAERGICDCDIELGEKPNVRYVPAQYDQIVINRVYQAIVEFEVKNKGPENAYVPTLRMELPPRVSFIRRVPTGSQSESDVSQIACSEIEEDGKNYVECYLEDPLRMDKISRFGLALDTSELTDTNPITLKASVSVGMPSEESDTTNNAQEIPLKVGQEASLLIRGTAATEKNAIKPNPDVSADSVGFLRNIKLEVRHTVSVLIEESDIKDSGVENGIANITVEISWPMRDANGNNLLYLSEVYVKDNQIKDNFQVDNPSVIDPECHFDYNSDCEKAPQASAIEGGDEGDSGVIAPDTSLNTNCSVPDPGCVTFNITIKLLKAGSINMKNLAFEMRSVIWLPTVLDSPATGFNATSTARIVDVGQNLVIPPGRLVQMNTQVYQEVKEQQDVVWIIIGAVIGGIVILAILILVLWKIGFFKRKMPPRDGSS